MKSKYYQVNAILFAAAVMVLLPGIIAHAEIITVNASGIVDTVTTQGYFVFQGSVFTGATMNGFCSYDTTTPDKYPASDYYGIFSIDTLAMTIGEYSFIHEISTETPEFKVWRTDMTYLASTDYATIFYNGAPLSFDYANVILLDLCNASTSGPDDHLPTSFPDISFFTYRNQFRVSSFVGGNGFTITGHLTSIDAIPEPGTICLVGLGGLGLLRRRRA